MSVQERSVHPHPRPTTTHSRASSNGLSRALSRRRGLSDPRQWTPEPETQGQREQQRRQQQQQQQQQRTANEEEAATEVSKARGPRFLFWLTMILLQASTVSTCISAVYLIQDARSRGPQALHIIWTVSSGASLAVLAALAWMFLRRRRGARRAAEAAIARLSADVDALVQQNIELQMSSRRSRDHGSTSGRRASPMGEEDYASYHRFHERGMDRQVDRWLEGMGPFYGGFEDVRGDSWFDGPSGGADKAGQVHFFTAPLRSTRTA
ncbi:hypothetical protein FGG08_005960 [Glutinoglossum americanum]|uniref:Uncharacterized protein n=1 Tax=Glutinoglossum americanum TaxID=1670608 RepID=A0A9P8I8C4_9PEZI|nr:hypothetical protein FGG08_005960 [Glutinoglossum americanum]